MTTAVEAKTATLYFRNGTSDKEYRVWLEPKADGYAVNYAYGRRNASLSTGTKTSTPVSYDAAIAIFDKLISEKMSKGYTLAEDGTPYRHTDKAKQVSGLLPQLLTVMDEADVRHIVDDPAWCMQEKYDGRRLMLRKVGSSVEGINKLGLVVGLPESVAAAACALAGDVILDGEVIGDRLWAFDLLESGGVDLRALPYRERYTALTGLLARSGENTITQVDCWDEALDKSEQLARLKSVGAEGVVFKRWDAPYTAGRPNRGGPQRKHKFVSTLSAVVSEVNQKRSVVVSLLNEQGDWRAVGSVTIPANQAVPPIGAVVEVRYLYAAPSLYQPVYLGERSDVEAHECVTAQLKFKAT